MIYSYMAMQLATYKDMELHYLVVNGTTWFRGVDVAHIIGYATPNHQRVAVCRLVEPQYKKSFTELKHSLDTVPDTTTINSELMIDATNINSELMTEDDTINSELMTASSNINSELMADPSSKNTTYINYDGILSIIKKSRQNLAGGLDFHRWLMTGVLKPSDQTTSTALRPQRRRQPSPTPSQVSLQLTQLDFDKIKEIDIGDGAEREIVSQPPPEVAKMASHQPLLLALEPEQQQAAAQVTHHMNTLMCLVAEHFTTLER